MAKDKFRTFLEEAPDAFFAHDLEGRITDVNRMACDSLGYSREEVINMTVMDVDRNYDQSAASACWEQAQPGKTVLLLGQHRRKDGTVFPVEVHLSAYIVDGSKIILALAHDITNRQQAERRQERLAKLYQALSEVNQAIVRMDEEEKLFPLVCKMAVDFGGLKMAWVGQLNQNSGLIEPVVSYGSGADYLAGIVISASEDIPEGRGPAAQAFRENRIVIVQDYQESAITKPWQKLAARYGWGSSGSFPIPRSGKPFALLGVYHEHTHAFDDEIVGLLDEMTRDIAFALDNFDRENERKLAEQNLRKSEEKFSKVFRNSPNPVSITSIADGRFIDVNDAWMDITGYAREEAIGRTAADLGIWANPDDRAMVVAELTKKGVVRDFEVVFKTKTDNEVTCLVSAELIAIGHEQCAVLVAQDITEKKRFDGLIWKQANFDPLTGLPNRNMFYDRLDQDIRKTHRDGKMLALFFIDLDRFKEVNDTLGHQTGDMLLVEAARRISACIRESDTVARLGGDEFTVILPQLHDTAHIEEIAQNIIDRLSEPFSGGREQAHIYLSASIGITLYPSDALDVEPLLRNADQAMYVAKNAGRNRFSYFTQSLQEAAQSRLRMLNDLRGALEAEQFVLYFQPIVDMSTGRIVKAEALLRWMHPERGLVSPMEFIVLAEETGLIVKIGDWAFREAARWASQWVGLSPDGFQMGVNVSAAQFHGNDGKIDAWFGYVQELGLSGHNIIIEITESLLLDADSVVTDKLARFRGAGIRVAIDDFGTGYSALSYLKKFHIDYLKIDQSFVRGLATDASDMALSEAIVVMAHKLGIKVIAEGVETAEQHRLLAEAGCDCAQGYLYSYPLPASEFENCLKKACRLR
ncbi:MAG TPA: EAL domain-containing protein [Sulfuriferula sp.]|nr:EAL domain-containing protein [Sulfuriferula sp.]